MKANIISNALAVAISVTIAGCNGASFSGSGARTGQRTLAPKDSTGDVVVSKTSGAVETPTPSPTPTDDEPVYDPKTNTYKLTVETSATKPITNLYLIIDNSFSMSLIQAKVAVAAEKLMRQVEAENLNVNLHLFTTSDFSSATAPNVSFLDAGVQRTIGLPSLSNGLHGDKGNSSYGNRNYFEIIQGVKKTIASPVDRSADSFWVSDEVIIGKSQFGTPDGTLKLREDMTAADLKAQIDLAVAKIANLGTAGSDREQPLAALYRISRSLPSTSDERSAFWIVTNEDDSTSRTALLSHETLIGPQSTVTLTGRIQYTSLQIPYEYLQNAVVVDGVTTQAAKWVRSTFYQNMFACKTNALCNATAGSVPCSSGQLALMTDKFALLNAGTNRAVAGATCTATLGTTNYGSKSSTKITDTCSSIDPVSNKTYSQAIQDMYPGELFNTAPCITGSVAPFMVKEHKRLYELPTVGPDIGTTEIGDVAIQNLKKVLGAKGFSVALIANDGINACGQTNFADAARLGAFLAKTPAPDLRISVCADDYGPVAKGIKDFISIVPKRTYKFLTDGLKIKSIVITTPLGVSTTLLPTDYTVSNGILEFRLGTFEVGDAVDITIFE